REARGPCIDYVAYHTQRTPSRASRATLPPVGGDHRNYFIEERHAAQEHCIHRRRFRVGCHTHSMTPPTDRLSPKRHGRMAPAQQGHDTHPPVLSLAMHGDAQPSKAQSSSPIGITSDTIRTCL